MLEESIFDLPKERLELIDHDIYKWQCCAEGCTNGTHVWDFGERPMYYFPRKVKASKNEGSNWYHCDRWYWTCGKHFKLEKQGIEFSRKEFELMEANLVFVKSITVTDIKFKL
jgi:hypothetical protein